MRITLPPNDEIYAPRKMSARIWRARARARAVIFLGAALTFGLTAACKKPRDLRGTATASPDGKTYLVLDDDKDGLCPLELDGRRWTARKGVAVEVAPGSHAIECAGTTPGTAFVVSAGTTFHFDYWGP